GQLTRFANGDGGAYLSIAAAGYSYYPRLRCNAAFLPAYPLLSSWLSAATGMWPLLALVVVAHASLATSFVLFARYLKERIPAPPSIPALWTLLAFGLLPTTMFFRMV